MYLKSLGFDKKAYLIGENGLKEEFDLCDIPSRGILEHATIPNPLASLDFLKFDEDIGAVVVGMDRSVTYTNIAFANYHLRNKDCLFVATNDDQTDPSAEKGEIPAAGSILSMLEMASGRIATVCGKPSSMLFKLLHDCFQFDTSRTVMVGDRLSTDITWGNENGISTLLVLTGVTVETEITTPNAKILPKFLISSLGDVTKMVNS
eukprot:TRINITY_DN2334_c0_g3_i10.p1 TRINITY_DN2334_c0_g3~~TRINITY_DN2334_c0_g3_i10.p1  ORF type:complete len:206 (+),score=43.68 TRINITY_DN2334_c0_g3_i10:531-1148(+)